MSAPMTPSVPVRMTVVQKRSSGINTYIILHSAHQSNGVRDRGTGGVTYLQLVLELHVCGDY